MRSPARLLARAVVVALLHAACGQPGPATPPDLAGDAPLADLRTDAVPADRPDQSPPGDRPTDAAIDVLADAAADPASDAAADLAGDAPADLGLDAGPDPAACEVQPGDTRHEGMAVGCVAVELAVLAGVSSPRVFVRGQINVPAAGSDPCLAVDSAEIISRESGAVVGTLSTPGAGRTGNSPYGPARVEGAIPAELTTVCMGSDRFDLYRLRVTGRVDGGTFEVICGDEDAPQTFWPPEVTVSCHRGLEHPPAAATLRSQSQGPGSAVIQGSMSFPRGSGPAATELDEQLSIIELQGSLSLSMPRGTPEVLGPYMLRTALGGQGTAGGSVYDQFEIISTDGSLDSQFCGQMGQFAPATLAQVSGTTQAGPFQAELALTCERIP